MNSIVPSHIVAVDPSIRSLGVSCSWFFGGAPAFCFGIQQRTSTEESWQGRALAIARLTVSAITEQLAQQAIHSVVAVVECPNNWFTGRGAASKDSESVQKLYFFVGALVHSLAQMPLVRSCYTVTPNDWKGQATKDVMMGRAQRYLESVGVAWPRGITDDAAEAILLAKAGVAHYQSLHSSEGDPKFPATWHSVGAVDMYSTGKLLFDYNSYI